MRNLEGKLKHAILVDVGRTEKPRTNGLTIVLDVGAGIHEIQDLAEVGAHWVDYAKIAWGSAAITQNLEKKVDAYRSHQIEPMLGGTLFEYAYLRNNVDNLLAFVAEAKLHIEISDGVIDLKPAEKLGWIERFASKVDVFSEIGGKTRRHELPWKETIHQHLSAGAKKIVVEGRELGPVGQPIREDFFQTVVSATEIDNLVFEALERPQQLWLLERLGPNANLANIRMQDALTLESFRHGLKEHTLLSTYERERRRN